MLLSYFGKAPSLWKTDYARECDVLRNSEATLRKATWFLT
jgi:hypothetical protein